MNIEIIFHQGPLPSINPRRCDGAGAVVVFEGVVRPIEAQRPITGLRYECYQPMAEHEMQSLATQAMQQFQLLAIRVHHSVGLVPNDACSFRLEVASVHRKQALAAMDWFIDQLKVSVPIWKHPVFIEAVPGVKP